MADALFTYDAMGVLERQGLDVSGNGLLDNFSADRIREKDARFVNEGGAWWLQIEEKTYGIDANGDPTGTAKTVNKTKSRLTDFGALPKNGSALSTIVGYAETRDINNVAAKITTEIDKSDVANKFFRLLTVEYPDASQKETGKFANGRLLKNVSAEGVTSLFHFDAYRRLEKEIGARLVETEYHCFTGRDDVQYIKGKTLPASSSI